MQCWDVLSITSVFLHLMFFSKIFLIIFIIIIIDQCNLVLCAAGEDQANLSKKKNVFDSALNFHTGFC